MTCRISGLTSQHGLQNLQRRLGRSSMQRKPAATVRLPEGEGVPQHLPEGPDFTWSPRQQEERLLRNRNTQDSQEQRQPSEGFMNSFSSSLSSLHLSPTSLFIYLPLPLCLSGCQPPDAWQSSPTAAGLVTFQTRASGPNTNASLCNGKGIFPCDVQPTLLDGSQDSQVFIRRSC